MPIEMSEDEYVTPQPTFIVNSECTFDDLNNSISARLTQIRGIAEALDKKNKNNALWALKDLSNECKQIAREMRKRFLAAGGDAFHNTQESNESDNILPLR